MTTSALLTVPTFIAKSIVVQTLAAATCVIFWPAIGSITATIFLGASVALLAATLIQLPMPWRVINSALPVAAAGTLAADIPNTVYLLPLFIAAGIYAPALLTRVPYYPTPRAAYGIILAELPVDRPFRFLDVGCGFGDLILTLAKHRPNGTFIGIELGPLPCLIGRLRAGASSNRNVQVLARDMWSYPFSDFDLVYTFLSPAAMTRIWDKAQCEMPPGSTFITNSFPVPAPAQEEIKVRDQRASVLYIHRMSRV